MARKLLSLVVALAVVLSSMSFAFAADPKAVSADVKEPAVKRAVEKLVALGMVEGIDGKYVPDQKLKRSELTKLIVIALGLGPAADAAMGATQFSDVGADHWASGYITVAAGQGIVQGMGDGTFSPDSEITFAQALTMLVRTLGYKDEFLKGVWPGNYLAKASEKGIYAGISITPGAAVKRGDFAIMMSNCLDAKVVVVGEYKDGGVTYKEDASLTLIKDKLKLDKIEVRPTENARIGGLGVDKVTLMFKKTYTTTDDGVDSAVAKALNTSTTYDVVSGLNVDTLMGASCYAYYSKDSQKVAYIEETGASTVYWDGIDKWVGATDTDSNTTDIILRWTGKQFKVDGGEKTYAQSVTDGTSKATIWVTSAGTQTQWTGAYKFWENNTVKGQDFGRFVVESNKIVFADLYRYDTTYTGMMIKSTDEAAKSLTYIDTSASETSLNLSSAYSSFSTYMVDTKVGAVSKIGLTDIKPFDVVYLAKARVDQKDVATLFVFRNTQTGVFTSITLDGKKMEFDSKSDSLKDFGGAVSYSKDNNATYRNSSSVGSRAADLNDFYNQKVTAIIDNTKKIRHLYGESVNSSDMYGIIKEMSSDISKQVRIYTINDESVLYSFEDTDKVLETSSTDVNEYDSLFNTFLTNAQAVNTNPVSGNFTFIKFKLNKDGKIAKNTVTAYGVDLSPTVEGNYATISSNFGDNSITATTAGVVSNYYMDPEVKIFNLNGARISYSSSTGVSTSGTWAISKWDNFKGKEVTSAGANLYLLKDVTNTQTVKAFVVLDTNINNITVDQKSAYLINSATEDSKNMIFVKLYGSDGATVKYELDGSLPAVLSAQSSKESAVIVNITSAGKAKVYASAYDANVASLKNNYSTVAGLVYKKEGNFIYINGNTTKYEVASDALIYKEKDKKSVSDILENRDSVIAVVRNGKIEAMEQIDAESYKSNQTFGTGMLATYTNGTDYKALFSIGYASGDRVNGTAADGGYYVKADFFTEGQAVLTWGSNENKIIAVSNK